MTNKQLEVRSFQGWDGKVEELFQTRQSSYLFGLGLEGFVRYLKVWNTDKTDKSGSPELVRCSRLGRPGSQSEPVCLALSESLSLLAVGYDDGGVVIHRGDITRDRGHKTKVLLERGHTLAGMALKTTEAGTFLYIATSEDVLLYNLTHKDRESRSVLDTIGASRGLAIAPINYSSETHFVTGQNDAIFCYNPEGRGQCYAFEGKKRLMYWYRGYLTTVSDEGLDKATITIFDVQNKFIGFTAPIKPILAVVSEWGSIFLVTQEGKIHQLLEKDTQSKLAVLFRKNFYDVAVKIARNQQYDAEGLVDIFRQYGDHLYAKGDQSGAIEQYIKTIGTLEPSYVIQKFLDAQKIHNLTAYLQALHRKGLASEDHTTLLLNCYTKLKDSSKLDEFIMTKDREVDFDVDIAINVCRQAGYSKHALALAEKHSKHDLYLKIVMENEKDYQLALQYISSLDPAQADSHMRTYGSVLSQNVPQEFTESLKSLIVRSQETGVVIKSEEYIHLFVNDHGAMVDYLEHLLTSGPSVGVGVHNTLLEYQLYAYKEATEVRAKAGIERKVMELLRADLGYTTDQALVLCELNNFQPGLLYLYQRSEMFERILKYHFSCSDYEGAITACRKFGAQRPSLWVSALQSIAQVTSATEFPPHHFKEVLDNIEKYRLLSPLQVVSTLSSCPTATLGVVRDYLLRTFGAEDRAMEEDRRVIEQYKADSEKIRTKLDKLSGSLTIFQSTKCSACHHALDLPTVHFLCGCGYHRHCFQSYSDSDRDCPACAPENKKILDILRSQEAARTQHDQFHAQLEKAEDGFNIVAEYLGRGLFSQPPEVAEVTSQGERVERRPGEVRDNTMTGLEVSEGRLRATDRRVTRPEERREETESRLRSDQPSQATVNIPSTGRLRLEESSRLSLPASRSSQYQFSVSPQVGRTSHRASPSTVQAGWSPLVPRREDIAPANPFNQKSNPFGSPTSDESLGEDNPFADNTQR